jgi:hypothetical protein
MLYLMTDRLSAGPVWFTELGKQRYGSSTGASVCRRSGYIGREAAPGTSLNPLTHTLAPTHNPLPSPAFVGLRSVLLPFASGGPSFLPALLLAFNKKEKKMASHSTTDGSRIPPTDWNAEYDLSSGEEAELAAGLSGSV